MNYVRIKDIDFKENINNRVYGIFMARDVEVRLQKDGKKFIDLKICDKDFVIDAKRFGASDAEIELMKNGGVYFGAIDIRPYAKSPTGYSCIIYNFDVSNMNPKDFVEWTDGVDEANEVITEALAIISESIYKDLVYNILVQHWNKFSYWTAASGMHHNQMGGLIVHTAEVISQSKILAEYWDSKYGPGFINLPLLMSGALLHDMAKIAELDVDATSGSTTYSTESALGTHITICADWITVEAYKLGLGYIPVDTDINSDESTSAKTNEQALYEKEAVDLLKHLILSHHGCKEYGSPISMNIPEALILNKADEISAEMYRYNKNFCNMDSGTSNGVWVAGNMVVTYKDLTK